MGVKEASIAGEGETYLIPIVGAGYDTNGIYIDLRVDFAGLVVKVVGTVITDKGYGDKSDKRENKDPTPDGGSYADSWTLLEAIPEIIGKRFYLDKQEQSQCKTPNYQGEDSGGFNN